MYNGFSMFSTTRQVSLKTEPGFRYFSDGPLISALASIVAMDVFTHRVGGVTIKRERERKRRVIEMLI